MIIYSSFPISQYIFSFLRNYVVLCRKKIHFLFFYRFANRSNASCGIVVWQAIFNTLSVSFAAL